MWQRQNLLPIWKILFTCVVVSITSDFYCWMCFVFVFFAQFSGDENAAIVYSAYLSVKWWNLLGCWGEEPGRRRQRHCQLWLSGRRRRRRSGGTPWSTTRTGWPEQREDCLWHHATAHSHRQSASVVNRVDRVKAIKSDLFHFGAVHLGTSYTLKNIHWTQRRTLSFKQGSTTQIS